MSHIIYIYNKYQSSKSSLSNAADTTSHKLSRTATTLVLSFCLVGDMVPAVKLVESQCKSGTNHEKSTIDWAEAVYGLVENFHWKKWWF